MITEKLLVKSKKSKLPKIRIGCCIFSIICLILGICLIYLLPKKHEECNKKLVTFTGDYTYNNTNCKYEYQYDCYNVNCEGYIDNHTMCNYEICNNIINSNAVKKCGEMCKTNTTNYYCYNSGICYTNLSLYETSIISFVFVMIGCVSFVISVFMCCSPNN